jgi:hypothetical protein
LIATCSFAALIGLMAAPPRVHAYEDQRTVGLGLGYAHAVSDALPGPGASIDLSASVGLNAVWTARAHLTYGLHPGSKPLHVGVIAAELLYVIDILEFVPYFGAGLGAVGQAYAGAFNAYPAAHAVAGIDYLLSRALALELDARAHLLLTALQDEPLYLTATLSVVWILDS